VHVARHDTFWPFYSGLTAFWAWVYARHRRTERQLRELEQQGLPWPVLRVEWLTAFAGAAVQAGCWALLAVS
jgi:hypothetical protein